MEKEVKMKYSDILERLDEIIEDGGYVLDKFSPYYPGDGFREQEILFSLDRSKKERVSEVSVGVCVGGGEGGTPCAIINKDKSGKLRGEINFGETWI